MYAAEGDKTEVLVGDVPPEWCTKVYDDPTNTKLPTDFELKDPSGKVQGTLKLKLVYKEPEQ
jgi:hypothetical protein